MKTLSLALAVATLTLGGLALGACATTPPPSAWTPADTSFTGWVRFTGEEFQLYADEDQVLQPFSRPCLSGAASRDLMRQAQDLAGQKVTVTGRTGAWREDLPGHRIAHQGSNIRNECRGTFVILADAIRPAN